MRTTATAALAGVIGIAVGATGWALLGPAKTSTDSKPAAVSAAARPAGATHYASAQAIADKLAASGFSVTMLHKDDGTLLTEEGASVYDLAISPRTGVPAGGDSGINMFRTHDGLTSWASLSQSMGGIAVIGDTWAVSLPSGDGDKVQSISMAPRIAKALGGTVRK